MRTSSTTRTIDSYSLKMGTKQRAVSKVPNHVKPTAPFHENTSYRNQASTINYSSAHKSTTRPISGVKAPNFKTETARNQFQINENNVHSRGQDQGRNNENLHDWQLRAKSKIPSKDVQNILKMKQADVLRKTPIKPQQYQERNTSRPKELLPLVSRTNNHSTVKVVGYPSNQEATNGEDASRPGQYYYPDLVKNDILERQSTKAKDKDKGIESYQMTEPFSNHKYKIGSSSNLKLNPGGGVTSYYPYPGKVSKYSIGGGESSIKMQESEFQDEEREKSQGVGVVLNSSKMVVMAKTESRNNSDKDTQDSSNSSTSNSKESTLNQRTYGLTTGKSIFDSKESKTSKQDDDNKKESLYAPCTSSSSEPKGLVGLRNIGNTCFMNSILQCLFNAPLLSDYFLRGNHRKEKNPKSKGVADAYANLLEKIRSQSGLYSSAETPHELKSRIARMNPIFSGYEQHDAQELLKAVLEGINDDLNRVLTKPAYKELTADSKRKIQDISDEWFNYMLARDNSVITDLFCGQLLSKTICTHCQNESLAFDNFWDIALSFPKSSRPHLTEMFEQFLKEETLEDLFTCEKCKVKRRSKKRFLIWRLPKILVVQLKRFEYTQYRRDKINKSVVFPVSSFDLSQFTKESADPSVRDAKYTLFGVVNHGGSLYGGHYTAECMNPYNQKWYNFNDSSVRETQMRKDEAESSSPYMLFYIKSSYLSL